MSDTVPQPTAVEELAARVYQNPLVQQALAGYSYTKDNVPIAGRALRVAESVAGLGKPVANAALPYLEPYLEKPASKITSVYDYSAEKSSQAVATTKQVAVTTGTVGIGAAVVATQLSLSLGVIGTNLVLDSLILTKKAGNAVVEGAVSAEKAVEDRIYQGIAKAQAVAKVPVDKAAEYSNSILDVSNAIVDRILGVNVSVEPADSGVRERVLFLARRIVQGLGDKAHENVIDPVAAQLRPVLDNLSKNLLLADTFRDGKAWAGARVNGLSSSVTELRTKLETEARNAASQPEAILMKSIRTSSQQVVTKLESLKDKKSQLTTNDGTIVDQWIAYVQSFDTRVGEAADLYAVSEEVLAEARQRITELAVWTASLVRRPANAVTAQPNGKPVANGNSKDH